MHSLDATAPPEWCHMEIKCIQIVGRCLPFIQCTCKYACEYSLRIPSSSHHHMQTTTKAQHTRARWRRAIHWPVSFYSILTRTFYEYLLHLLRTQLMCAFEYCELERKKNAYKSLRKSVYVLSRHCQRQTVVTESKSGAESRNKKKKIHERKHKFTH